MPGYHDHPKRISNGLLPFQIIAKLKQHLEKKSAYSWRQGQLTYNGKLVISNKSEIILRLLREFYDSAIGGHSGFLRTYKRIGLNVKWKGMKESIRKYVAACKVCQKYKVDCLTLVGLLQPLSIPNQIWEDISLDFIECLPNSDGFNSILVTVDQLSKQAHFSALKHLFTAQQVAKIFLRDIVRLYGIPASIKSRIRIKYLWVSSERNYFGCRERFSKNQVPTILNRMGRPRWLIGGLKHTSNVLQGNTQNNRQDGCHG